MTWKDRRKMAYLMYEFNDVGLPYEYGDYSNYELISMIVEFFRTESQLIYPAKSYFVAIVYAYYLQKYFNKDFYAVLDDEELLTDDLYFVPYNKNKYVYDKVIEQIGCIDQYESIQKTVQYFKQEFLIGDEQIGVNN
jgi:hypothetical protein